MRRSQILPNFAVQIMIRPMIDTKRIKPFVLPGAIVLGVILHDLCAALAGIVPYLVFSILLLAFSSTELRRLKFERLDLWLMLFQTAASIITYTSFILITDNETLAQGMMLGALCPVAASVTVVAVILGAKRENTIAYTIAGNLLICVLAPVLFSFIGKDNSMSFCDSFYSIFGRIVTIIGLPFFVMLALQLWVKPVARQLCRYNGISFYLWATALLLTLGQTIDFIIIHGTGHLGTVVGLGFGAIAICLIQLSIGRAIGKHYDDAIAGQQLLFQKNSAMGIWMANTYLDPLASSFLAFYSIWQNIINSWQIWRKSKNSKEYANERN